MKNEIDSLSKINIINYLKEKNLIREKAENKVGGE